MSHGLRTCAAGTAAQAPLRLHAGCTTACIARRTERSGSAIATPFGARGVTPERTDGALNIGAATVGAGLCAVLTCREDLSPIGGARHAVDNVRMRRLQHDRADRLPRIESSQASRDLSCSADRWCRLTRDPSHVSSGDGVAFDPCVDRLQRRLAVDRGHRPYAGSAASAHAASDRSDNHDRFCRQEDAEQACPRAPGTVGPHRNGRRGIVLRTD